MIASTGIWRQQPVLAQLVQQLSSVHSFFLNTTSIGGSFSLLLTRLFLVRIVYIFVLSNQMNPIVMSKSARFISSYNYFKKAKPNIFVSRTKGTCFVARQQQQQRKVCCFLPTSSLSSYSTSRHCRSYPTSIKDNCSNSISIPTTAMTSAGQTARIRTNCNNLGRVVTTTKSFNKPFSSPLSSLSLTPIDNNYYQYKVYLAVGSNIGDRFGNIKSALKIICQNNENNNNNKKATTRLVRTSYLYETAPMYVTDQPAFLNGVVEIETNLDPIDLLHIIKYAEQQTGRDLESSKVHRNGPRPVDLDILFYYNKTTTTIHGDDDNNNTNNQNNYNVDVKYHGISFNSHNLTIPHPRIQERDFVLIPLIDIVGSDDVIHPLSNISLQESLDILTRNKNFEEPTAVRVLPLQRGRFIYFNETLIMGILNVTPDSFSDGGKYYNNNNNTGSSVMKMNALQQALDMEQQGAAIIDIGGESTRPGAKEVDVTEQIQRTIPIINEIRKVSDIPISIDTRHSQVAKAAIEAGADIVNDVSGGQFDPDMFQTVSELGVPMIIMHMRGTPETMQSLVQYDDVVSDVGQALREQSNNAEIVGIHRWEQIIDPGIGFAKDIKSNLLLLRHLSKLRSMTNNLPILLGTSRKGFIGKLSNVTDASLRDPGTIASVVASLCLDNSTPIERSCNIIRVHNVKDCKQAMLVMDAIKKDYTIQ